MKTRFSPFLIACFWLISFGIQAQFKQKFNVTVKGQIDNQKGLKNYDNVLVGIFWHADDANPEQTGKDKKWNMSDEVSKVKKNGKYNFKITEPPLAGSCIVTPRFALSIGFVVAFVDKNNNKKHDDGEEIIGVAHKHTLSFVKGSYQKGLDALEKRIDKKILTLRKLKNGIYINKVLPKAEHKIPGAYFDDLHPEKKQKVKIKLIIPKNKKDMKVPNWT